MFLNGTSDHGLALWTLGDYGQQSAVFVEVERSVASILCIDEASATSSHPKGVDTLEEMNGC